VPRAAEQRHQRRRKRRAEGRERTADREREPERLRGELPGVGLAPGAVEARDVGSRRVGQEVAQGDDGRQQRRRQGERRELRCAQVSDDRGVGEQVERLGGERAERREGEPENLAVVRGAAWQEADSTIRS
jgi:hypothetical protein